jgi:IS30 family transposase
MQLLQEINSGTTDPKLLDKQSRQQCVEMLVTEGYTRFQIAQLLKRSEKTISRDLREVRQRNELTPNVEFAKQLVGEVYNKAMVHHNYLMRLTRARDTSTSEKIQSELAAWRIIRELIERLQSLGYLPSKPKEIVGTFYNHSRTEDDNSPQAMRRMLLGIEEIAKDSDLLDSEVTSRIKLLRARIDASEIAVEIKQLEAKTSDAKEGLSHD